MKDKITHIFFDLDHTLWDYDTNAGNVLRSIYNEFELTQKLDLSEDQFIKVFFQTNATLWDEFNHGKVDRDTIRSERFKRILRACGTTDFSSEPAMNQYFLYHCPRQKAVMEDAMMCLDYLSKRYHLSIITNGFDDVQSIKLKSCGLDKYFTHVFTSETIGIQKPQPEIFHHALQAVKSDQSTAVMIGDNPLTDIQGAQNAGIEAVFYNPGGRKKSECSWQIQHLSDLLKIL